MVKFQDVEDEELVRLAQDGDPDAFGKLAVRYRNRMYRVVRRITKTDEDAEDVIQEAFFKAYRSLSGFKGESRFSTWLHRITVNQAIMRLRRKDIDSVPLDVSDTNRERIASRWIHDTAPDPLARLVEDESQEVLNKAIAGLPPSYKAVFVLRLIEGLSTDETGRVLDLSTAATKSRLHRARTAVRDELLRHVDVDVSRHQTEGLCSVA